ncbi:glucose-methanol-choline oxidoreductase, partial [Collybia nuda]
FPEQITAHDGLAATVLKAHPSSIGTVRLTGTHFQDKLDIQKQRFQAAGAAQDIIDLRNGIKAARAVVASANIAKHIKSEDLPGAAVQTDAQLDDDIYKRSFGHHACCTNPMGTGFIADANAVLDGDFRVRGVANLRVVDASAWPRVPGFFLATQTYMLSEKAADVIIKAAKEVAA